MEDRGQVDLPLEAKRDINWSLNFLTTFNGITIFDQKSVDSSIELHASLQGLAAVWRNQVYAIDVTLGYLDFQIVHFEMLNILTQLIPNHTWVTLDLSVLEIDWSI